MRFNLFLKLGGNHSRPTGADCWPAITQLNLPLAPLLLPHPFAHVFFIHHLLSLDTNTFGPNQGVWKKCRVYHHIPQANAFQSVFKAWREPFQTHRCWLLASHNPTWPSLHICFHPPSAFCRCQHFWFSQGVWKKKRDLSSFFPGQCVSICF